MTHPLDPTAAQARARLDAFRAHATLGPDAHTQATHPGGAALAVAETTRVNTAAAARARASDVGRLTVVMLGDYLARMHTALQQLADRVALLQANVPTADLRLIGDSLGIIGRLVNELSRAQSASIDPVVPAPVVVTLSDIERARIAAQAPVAPVFLPVTPVVHPLPIARV